MSLSRSFFKLRNLHPILTLVPCIEIIIFRRKQFFLSAKCMSLFAIGFPNVMSFRNSIVFREFEFNYLKNALCSDGLTRLASSVFI